MLGRLNHVAIAVKDAEKAAETAANDESEPEEGAESPEPDEQPRGSKRALSPGGEGADADTKKAK